MSKLNEKLPDTLDRPAEELIFLEALPARAQAALAEDIQAARQSHKREIVSSLEEALKHIPRLLRGPIRKIFGV